MNANDYPVVLVHGLIGSISAPEILQAFNGTAVYAPDLIGYGELSGASTDKLVLRDQSKHIAEFISDLGTPVHLVGHSVGGAVAALVAMQHKELVKTYTSVEGNFTLKDAFWSAQLAKKSEAEAVEIFQGYKDNPEVWIAGAGVTLNPYTSRLANEWLANQPAKTVKAQAKAVVAETGEPAYLDRLQALMLSDMPVHLIAGAHSAEAWDTPEWANELCTVRVNIPKVGHLMMAESPAKFAGAILACLNYS